MAFYDIHELNNIEAIGDPLLINDLSYLKDDTFLPINKLKSVGLEIVPDRHPKAQSPERRAWYDSIACRRSGEDGSGGIGDIGWISKDSTTLDAQKAVRMCLDSVPMNSYIKDYWDIYDKSSDINRYKSVYYRREDLPGQIQYYVDPEMTNPFFPPLFPKSTRTFGAIYIDPMNNAHYDFRRATKQPLDCDDCGIAEFRDLQSHREDILANIMRPRNRREYEPVHFNFMTRYGQSLT